MTLPDYPLPASSTTASALSDLFLFLNIRRLTLGRPAAVRIVSPAGFRSRLIATRWVPGTRPFEPGVWLPVGQSTILIFHLGRCYRLHGLAE